MKADPLGSLAGPRCGAFKGSIAFCDRFFVNGLSTIASQTYSRTWFIVHVIFGGWNFADADVRNLH